MEVGGKGGAALKARFGITETPFFLYTEGLDQHTQYQLDYDASDPGEQLVAWLSQQVQRACGLAVLPARAKHCVPELPPH